MTEAYAFGFLLLFVLFLVFHNLRLRRQDPSQAPLREIEALRNLPETVGEAVESGRRLHLSLGSGQIGQTDTATTLAGLTAASLIASVAVVSDKPPVITSADGAAMMLAQDVLKQVYKQQNAADRYDGDAARVVGLTPMAFATALTPLIKDEAVAGNVLIGPVGPEAILLTEAASRARVTTIAGSDNPAAQAVLFAAADHPVVGEDVYAVSAYLGRSRAHVASLRAQDGMRFVLALVIIVGVIWNSLAP